MIGKTISHFEILDQIGSGGMGVVYRARDLHLDRISALKFLPADLTRDAEAKQRFILEAKTASSLQHTNICVIHDVDETADGQVFISMEYIDGESLGKKIESGALPPEEAVSIGIQVALGLAQAHEHGIVHRDIKPANIIVTRDGVAKIVDFGLAKLARPSNLTVTGATLGTVAYMSPEQARGEAVDHRTDLWSLGVVLYEACTGVRPFESEYQQALMYAILNEDPRPPRALQPALPEALEAIILRALAKKPADRYQSAEALVEDLRAMRPPLPAGITPRRGILGRVSLGRPVMALSAVVLLAVALVLFYVVPTSAVPFNSRDWIVVADFENSTGEDVFDRALNTAFSVSITQSNHVNVVPRSRMGDVLRRMRAGKSEMIDEATAREIAVREELALVVVPGISRVGSQYVLTWKIEDARDGLALQSGVLPSLELEEILPALDDMTRAIRRALGESRLSIVQRGSRLTRVTTKSLEALKQYSLGLENQYQANFEQARFHYSAALNLDSAFTSARASLGMLCYERFDTTEGKRLLSGALSDLDGLTEKERLGILAFHARAVENDLARAAAYWTSLLSTYPDYGVAHNNLGFQYYGEGKLEEAAREYREAIRCDPSLYVSYFSLEWLYLYETGEVDSAVALCQRHIQRAPDHVLAYDNLGYAYVGIDSLDSALAAFTKLVQMNPGYTTGLYRLSDTYRLLGRYEEALPPLRQVSRVDPSDVYPDYQIGILHELMNKKAESAESYRRFLAHVEGLAKGQPAKGTTLIDRGKALIRLGDVEQGLDLGLQGFQLDSSAHFEYAQLLTLVRRYDAAVQQLERAVAGGFRNYVWIKLNPDLWDLRHEEGYQQLMKRVLKG